MTSRLHTRELKSLLLIILCCFTLNTWAQGRRNQLTVAAGAQYGFIQDRHASPVTYSLKGSHYGLSFKHEGSKSYWRVDLSGSMGQVSPRYLKNTMMNLQWPNEISGKPETEQVSYRADYLAVQVNVEYLRPIHLPSPWKLWIGPGLSGAITFTEISRYFWPLSVNGLTLSARSTYTVRPRHQITGGLGMYVMGFVTRFHYASDPSLPNTTLISSFFKEDTDFRFLNSLQRIDINLGYRYQLQKNIYAGIQYNGGWLSTQTPRSLRFTQSNYQILIAFSI